MEYDQELAQLKETLAAKNAARFVDAVNAVIDKGADMVLTTVEAFAGKPDVLYAALKYASLSGVEVRIAPRVAKAAA